ncbi:MAG: EAL domain-containing protein [Rhodospirillaceae bacterium]|nr:EAL domain-containing protein [Rhodospirillaceae bacterium]
MQATNAAALSFPDVFPQPARQRLVSSLFERSATAIAVTDRKGHVVWANDACADLLSLTPIELLHTKPRLLSPDTVGESGWIDVASSMEAGRTWQGEFMGFHVDGEAALCDATVIPVQRADSDGGESSSLVMLVDQSKRAVLDQELIKGFPLYFRAVEQSADGLLVIDHHGRIAFANPAGAIMLGSTTELLKGQEFGLPFGIEGNTTSIELMTGNRLAFVDMRTAPISWEGEDATLVVLHDMTQVRDAETALAMRTQAMEAVANGIITTDPKGMVTWANRAMTVMTGYAVNELVAHHLNILRSGHHAESFYQDLETRIQRGEVWRGRVINRHKDGHLYTAEQTISPVRDAAGRITQFVIIQEDISERLRAQDELIRLAQYDTLTGLPNRTLFMEHLQAAIARAKRAGDMVAVMLLDLDNFKFINSNFGHQTGDALLVAAKDMLVRHLRTTDTLARLDGDEFAILLEGVKDMGAANATIRRLFDALWEPVQINGHTLKAGASAGVAMYPKDDTEPTDLLADAELAMYQAKSQGRHALCYFDRDADIRKRLSLEEDLRHAVERKQLWLAYQPQVDVQSGRVVGAEALIRWTHDKRGVIPPNEFIPIAESSDLIITIGDWIVDEICRQSKEWQDMGLPRLQLGFNVSGVQFRRANLHEHVMDRLMNSGLSVADIDIEITETVAMERTGKVRENFGRLNDAGVSFSMDDFGTGYSSLSNLQAFPVRRLKVDGSFVAGIGKRKDDEKIVEAIISLSKSLGLKVVAEGVETEIQARFLKDCGCEEIQGYLVSKPLPPAVFADFVRQYKGFDA